MNQFLYSMYLNIARNKKKTTYAQVFSFLEIPACNNRRVI